MKLKSHMKKLSQGGVARAGILFGAAAMAVVAAMVVPSGGMAQAGTPSVEPASLGGPISFRRLSEDQYKRSIGQIFGADVPVGGRFEPGLREDGLMAIGESKVVVTPAGFEQYAARAREISAYVMDEKRRAKYLSCDAGATFDRACAQRFFDKYGMLLFRRPLQAAERAAVLKVAQDVSKARGSMVAGLTSGLYSLLVSPAFVFRVETAETDPARPGTLRLDAYSLATRISFLLWDSTPDEELLDAAKSGALRTPQGLNAQVDRLMASRRLEHGVRAYFSDMLGYDEFNGLTKDSAIFPIFNPRLRDDAQEQTLKTIVNHLLTKKADYRDLFTTRETFLTRSLAALYSVPMNPKAMGGWMPYTFPKDSPHSGLLTLPGFLMLDLSHEGRSSPTIRGMKVRQNLLCQTVPNPPANVNFTAFEDATGEFKTARDRLNAHNENPVCAGCHKITDPIGLALENYTAVGQFRTHENGARIDPTGEFEGKPYKNALEVNALLRESPSLSSCVVQRTFEYGAGRKVAPGEETWLEYLTGSFAADGYRYPALLRRIAVSPAFQAVAAEQAAPKNTIALNRK